MEVIVNIVILSIGIGFFVGVFGCIRPTEKLPRKLALKVLLASIAGFVLFELGSRLLVEYGPPIHPEIFFRTFSRWGWSSQFDNSPILAYEGDNIRFQNGFGVFSNHTCVCHYDPDSETVLKVSARQRNL